MTATRVCLTVAPSIHRGTNNTPIRIYCGTSWRRSWSLFSAIHSRLDKSYICRVIFVNNIGNRVALAGVGGVCGQRYNICLLKRISNKQTRISGIANLFTHKSSHQHNVNGIGGGKSYILIRASVCAILEHIGIQKPSGESCGRDLIEQYLHFYWNLNLSLADIQFQIHILRIGGRLAGIRVHRYT